MFNSKKQINKASALVSIITMAALAIIANLLSAQVYGRWDATENRDYSISGTTKQVLSELDDVVNVKAYFTAELPGYLQGRNLEVRDMLAEFSEVSGGNVAVTFLNPVAEGDIEKEARGLGIPTLQFNVVEKDKYEVTNGYLGLAVFYGDEQEIIPIVQDTSSLEYDLVAAVSRVTRDEVPEVAFMTGRGAFSRMGDMAQVNQLLERQYRVRDFDITAGALVPESIDTLIIPGINETITKREQYVIDQFLMRGGDILVLTEGVKINPTELTAEKLTTGLDELLANWGIRLNKNLVLDASNELAAFRTDQVQFFSPYPFWVKIPKAGFNPESGIVNKLESVVLTWASNIEVLDERIGDATTKSELVRTTAAAWAQDGDWQLNPRLIEAPKEGTQESKVLAAMLAGSFKSLFSADSIPATETKDKDGDEKSKFLPATEDGRVIVVGDADFPLDINLQRFASNTVFFQNLVDSLTTDERLIAIRSKTVTDRPLKTLSDASKGAIKWANILGISALFAGYGIIRFGRRRKAQVVI